MINMDRLLDKLEHRGYKCITSERLKAVSYAIKGPELTIITGMCGCLNMNIHSWTDLRDEIDEIIRSIA